MKEKEGFVVFQKELKIERKVQILNSLIIMGHDSSGK